MSSWFTQTVSFCIIFACIGWAGWQLIWKKHVARFWAGLNQVREMDAAPDVYFKTHVNHPFIELPLVVIPSQTFLVAPSLIKKFYSCPTLDSLETKRELGISVFNMPPSCLPVSSARSSTITSIEQVYHTEMSPARLADLGKRFKVAWADELRSEWTCNPAKSQTIDLNGDLYAMMVKSAVHAFFGVAFPASDIIVPLRQILSHLAGGVISGSLPWLIKDVARLFMGGPARAGSRALVGICRDWIRSHGTGESCELVKRTEDLARQSGWTQEETVTMLAMLLFTLVANSSDAIGWAVTAILQSPELFRIIRTEAQRIEQRMPDEILTATNLAKSCPNLYSALHETLRIFTSPLSVRVASANTLLATHSTKVFIPKGWRVIAPARSINVDTSVWGPDASAFKGGRFCEQNGPSPRDMAPFGGGASICSGRHFAIVELSTALVSLLTAFSFDTTSMQILDHHDKAISPPLFDIIDVDGTCLSAKWAGAIADSEGAQSGVFRAKHKCLVGVRLVSQSQDVN